MIRLVEGDGRLWAELVDSAQEQDRWRENYLISRLDLGPAPLAGMEPGDPRLAAIGEMVVAEMIIHEGLMPRPAVE